MPILVQNTEKIQVAYGVTLYGALMIGSCPWFFLIYYDLNTLSDFLGLLQALEYLYSMPVLDYSYFWK